MKYHQCGIEAAGKLQARGIGGNGSCKVFPFMRWVSLVKGGFALHGASEPMRAQPPGPADISAQQTASAQPCRTWTEMKRLAGSCSLMGSKGFCFSPYRAVVTRMGELGVLVFVTERFSPLCKSISEASADPFASVQ